MKKKNYIGVYALGPALLALLGPSAVADDVVGDNNDNILIGTPKADRMFGLGGNDRLSGLGGPDSLFGGPGNDFMNGGPGDDFLDAGGDGQSGALFPDAGGSAQSGVPFFDSVFGGTGNDTCVLNSIPGISNILACDGGPDDDAAIVTFPETDDVVKVSIFDDNGTAKVSVDGSSSGPDGSFINAFVGKKLENLTINVGAGIDRVDLTTGPTVSSEA